MSKQKQYEKLLQSVKDEANKIINDLNSLPNDLADGTFSDAISLGIIQTKCNSVYMKCFTLVGYFSRER